MVFGAMGFEDQALKVCNVVVTGVAINMVDLMTFRDWSVMKFPYVPMKPVTCARKIAAMRKVFCVWVTIVFTAIEDHCLDDNAIFTRESHDAPSSC